MFILNKKSGMVQECRNEDVIELLSKDNGYVVAESPEACLAGMAVKSSEKPVEALPVKPDKVPDEEKEQATVYSREELTAKNVKALRAIAKEMGITAYSNMDKATLVEVILAY